MRALMKTRDQLQRMESTRYGRIVSLDFNHSGREKPAYGIEIKMPSDSTPREITIAKSWAAAVQALYLVNGHEVKLRGDDGVKIDGRGVSGFIHTEPFFVGDVEARRIIQLNANWYCKILMFTLGQLPYVTFILPHKSNDPGAVSRDGMLNERDFAKYVLMPHLQDIAGEEPVQFALPTGYETTATSTEPQVSFTEIKS
jgi:hypothetical protein